MKVIASTKDMPREEWLALRRRGIGGSDAAAIMGVSQWATPLSVYADKLGISPEKPQTEAMRIGTDLEDYVAKRFAEHSGYRVQRYNKMLQHPEHDWMLANIDRRVLGTDADFVGLECKTTNPFNPVDFAGGSVPPTYFWQCQHYMAVTGAPFWFLAVLVLGKDFHVFQVARDDALIDRLIDREEDFWENNILGGITPEPMGTAADDAAIADTYPQDNGSSVDISDMRSTLDRMDALKEHKRRLDEQIDQLAQKVKERMGAAATAHCSGYRVTWKNVEICRIDIARLRSENPKIYEMYSTPKNARRFDVRKENRA